jgi:hypothetical protein
MTSRPFHRRRWKYCSKGERAGDRPVRDRPQNASGSWQCGGSCPLAVCDQRARSRASALVTRAEYVELANHPDYQDLFMAMLGFPAGPASPYPGGASPEAGR